MSEVPRWIDALDLSSRARQALLTEYWDIDAQASGPYPTIAAARERTEQEWLRVPGCGRITVAEIMAALHGTPVAPRHGNSCRDRPRGDVDVLKAVVADLKRQVKMLMAWTRAAPG